MQPESLTGVASSGPVHHRNEEFVARLQRSQVFRDYQQAFQVATGLPLGLRAAGSFRPPLAGSRQINPFCALLAGSSKVCAACLQLQARAETAAADGPATVKCFSGLSESVIPVRLGETVIGYLQTGQILLRKPTAATFRTAVRQLEAWHVRVDLTALEEAFFQTRVVPKARYEAVLRMLASFAQHLSLVSNEIVVRETPTEPAAVTRARAFIAEHLGETLALEQVARAASVSAFYFCKVFKAALGVTFTDYVARARVEKAKQLLWNPQVRVSEAAFAAGFQSLSQFNRVFRRIVGESPSTYREHRAAA